MSCSCDFLKKSWDRFMLEFSCQNLGFTENCQGAFNSERLSWKTAFGHDPNRCIRNYSVFLFIRVVLFLIIFGLTIGSMVKFWKGGAWFIYLTHWGLLIECTYFTLAVIVTYRLKNSQNDTYMKTSNNSADVNTHTNVEIEIGQTEATANTIDNTPFVVKAMWLCWDIILPGSFVIFILYWLAVFQPGDAVTPIGIFAHGINFVLLVVDASLSSAPFLFLQGLYLFIFGLVFIIWSYVFYVSGLRDPFGNRFIYPVLDWANPGTAAAFSAISLFILVPIVVFLFWLFTNLINQTCIFKETKDKSEMMLTDNTEDSSSNGTAKETTNADKGTEFQRPDTGTDINPQSTENVKLIVQ